MTRPFGEVRGQPVVEAPIGATGIAASIISYGAILRDLTIETARGPVGVTLGYADVGSYVTGQGYVGAIAGRYANRIGGACFTLDGETHRPVPNEGENQLHGGPEGFSSRVWRLAEALADRVTLELVSADGDMGFPGEVHARVTYEAPAPMILRITTEATTSKATPLNLVSHAYWNLDGGGDILGHRLTMAADRIVAVDSHLIPTGALPDVAGTPFDFRKPRLIGEAGIHYDINYALDRQRPGLVQGAVLQGQRSGIRMEVWTTEPGIQLYDGKFLGAPFGPHGGLCLECQRFPDAPNQPQFPSAILRPGERSRQVTELRFSADET
ncbi:galactose mutarotase [Phreatobacter aquaticus]|uniref:Aldose 1-epimerase n=1 Tax=Phreatobacter aquaticus TaxID=2570229 RepID=A0A4D7QPF0_9HYPH|nr:aldose epimerase family protein [Phreatobacter aquaticus]QCK87793.1 galactose mutarotase [Phreatobacter aquaticus]